MTRAREIERGQVWVATWMTRLFGAPKRVRIQGLRESPLDDRIVQAECVGDQPDVTYILDVKRGRLVGYRLESGPGGA